MIWLTLCETLIENCHLTHLKTSTIKTLLSRTKLIKKLSSQKKSISLEKFETTELTKSRLNSTTLWKKLTENWTQ